MKDNCYIDGVSTWDRYGVWITKGGYNDLLVYPSLKEPAFNDWPEEDGIEVDLSAPKLSDKTVTITFLSKDIPVDFIAFISTPGYHTLHIPSLGRSWQIRLLSHPGNKIYRGGTPFSLQFAEDIPVRHLVDNFNPGITVPTSSYYLDGIPLSDYGIIVDKGRDEVLKSPSVKMNLNREIQTVDGVIYDADHVVFASKEVTFKCRLKAISAGHFWNCYDAFFSALVAPGERFLYVDYVEGEFPCYYQSTSGFKIITLRDGPVMAEFSLTLVFTVFRIDGNDYLLSTESGELIITEDGEFYIDTEMI